MHPRRTQEDTLTLTLRRHRSETRPPLTDGFHGHNVRSMRQRGNHAESEQARHSQNIPHFLFPVLDIYEYTEFHPKMYLLLRNRCEVQWSSAFNRPDSKKQILFLHPGKITVDFGNFSTIIGLWWPALECTWPVLYHRALRFSYTAVSLCVRILSHWVVFIY